MGLFVLIPVLWFLPEYWGSGHFFRGVSARQPPALQQPRVRELPVLQGAQQRMGDAC